MKLDQVLCDLKTSGDVSPLFPFRTATERFACLVLEMGYANALVLQALWAAIPTGEEKLSLRQLSHQWLAGRLSASAVFKACNALEREGAIRSRSATKSATRWAVCVAPLESRLASAAHRKLITAIAEPFVCAVHRFANSDQVLCTLALLAAPRPLTAAELGRHPYCTGIDRFRIHRSLKRLQVLELITTAAPSSSASNSHSLNRDATLSYLSSPVNLPAHIPNPCYED